MKTKDFVNHIGELGGFVDSLGRYLRIWESGDILAVVDSERTGNFNIEDYEKLIENNMFNLIIEYASTPLDKRKEEKKRYVNIYDSTLGYLNINTSTNTMTVDGQDETCGFKTKFTNEEIKQLKQREDIPLDWDKVHFEDAE